MTFEEWWKQYCTEPFWSLVVKEAAQDAWNYQQERINALENLIQKYQAERNWANEGGHI